MSQDNPRWKQRPPGSNWGDFGPDDQNGRLNLLTPERVKRAVTLGKGAGKRGVARVPKRRPPAAITAPAHATPPPRSIGRFAKIRSQQACGSKVQTKTRDNRMASD